MNKADSERIAAFLSSAGYKEQKGWIGAKLVVLTTCGIRQSAEDRVYGLVNHIRQNNPSAKIVITGCLAKRQDVMRRLKGKVDLFLPINELPLLLEKLAGKEDVQGLEKAREMAGEKYLLIEPEYESAFSAYLPIGNGCNNFCSYCVVPYARGREVYRPATHILAEAKSLVERGYREIILIAQNVNSYKSGCTDFPLLLQKLVKIKGDFWIRFSSSHPKDLSPELIKTLGTSDKICHHLHVAVQSGDDAVLKAMNRQYTAARFKELIAAIRKAKPGIAVTTDAIVGFPGETLAQFKNTARLFREMDFDMAYTAQFSPRPGTAAWKMKDNVSRDEKKRRERVLNAILAKSGKKINKTYLGKKIRVLTEGKNSKGKYYGKSSTFKTVVFKAEGIRPEEIIGSFVKVGIGKINDFGLEGKYEGKD